MPGRIVSLFRNLVRRRAVEHAQDDELQSAVELLTGEKVARPEPPAGGRLASRPWMRLAFGQLSGVSSPWPGRHLPKLSEDHSESGME